MTARLGPGNLLYDHGLPMRKLAMDRGAPASVPWSSLSPGQQRLLGRVANAWETIPAADQQKLARLSMDAAGEGAADAVQVTLDTGEALRDREQLAKLIPHYNRL